jgi:hypothetical protein
MIRLAAFSVLVVVLVVPGVLASMDVRDITLASKNCTENPSGSTLNCRDQHVYPDDLPFTETPLAGSTFTLRYGCQVSMVPTGIGISDVDCEPVGMNLTASCDTLEANRPAGSVREMVSLVGYCTVPYTNGTSDWGVDVSGTNIFIINSHYLLYVTPVRDVDFMATSIEIEGVFDEWLPFLVFTAAAIWGWQGRNLFLAVIGSIGMLSALVLPLWTTPVIILFGVLAIWADYFAHYGKRRDQEIAPGAPTVGGAKR